MDTSFTYVHYILREGNISRRVRFLVRDLQLRMNNWVPQRAEEVHSPTQETQQETLEKTREQRTDAPENTSRRSDAGNSLTRKAEISRRETSENPSTAEGEEAPLLKSPQLSDIKGVHSRREQCQRWRTTGSHRRAEKPPAAKKDKRTDNRVDPGQPGWQSNVLKSLCQDTLVYGLFFVSVMSRGPEMLARSGLLKTFLTDEHKLRFSNGNKKEVAVSSDFSQGCRQPWNVSLELRDFYCLNPWQHKPVSHFYPSSQKNCFL